jgi:hypothetical protein
VAVGGILCGVLGNVMLLPIWLVWGRIQDGNALRDAQTNLKELCVAMHAYHDTYKRLPASAITAPDGRPLLSWRVAVLPYVGEMELYQEFKLDEPWDSDHNKALLPRMPKVFRPTKGTTPEPHSTYYQVFTGPDTPFRDPRAHLSLMRITDGTSNTLPIVEASAAVPWTRPEDIAVGKAPLTGRVGGHWPGGFNAAFADGPVRWLPFDRVDDRTLRTLVGPNDGQMPPPGLFDNFRR